MLTVNLRLCARESPSIANGTPAAPANGLPSQMDRPARAQIGFHREWIGPSGSESRLHREWNAETRARSALHLEWNRLPRPEKRIHREWIAKPELDKPLHREWIAKPKPRSRSIPNGSPKPHGSRLGPRYPTRLFPARRRTEKSSSVAPRLLVRCWFLSRDPDTSGAQTYRLIPERSFEVPNLSANSHTTKHVHY